AARSSGALDTACERPGGHSGNASAITARAPTAAAVRQATRAPLLRPPWISGTAGASFRSVVTTSAHAASCLTGKPGARAPLTRYGWVTRATSPPRGRAASRTASRSGAPALPPAPWVSTSRNRAAGPSPSSSASAAPPSVAICTLVACRVVACTVLVCAGLVCTGTIVPAARDDQRQDPG